MPGSVDPNAFVEALQPVVQQCAQAAQLFYGRVPDVGKEADRDLTGAKAQDASAVFTAVDSGIQDILLSVVLERFPGLRCIAEEDTPLRRRFAGARAEQCVILDPIDGTLHFCNGDGPYHISIGLARAGVMEAAVVARPTEQLLFTAIRDQGAYVQRRDGPATRLLIPSVPQTRAAFISSKARDLQAPARERLLPREHPIGAALILTSLAQGTLCAYLTRQVEVYDVGPPALIATEAGGRCAVGNGRPPRYDRRRKFGVFMAAGSDDLLQFLLTLARLRRPRPPAPPR